MQKQFWVIVFLILGVYLSAMTVAMQPPNFHTENAGSINNPYQISNLANLRWLSETTEVWGAETQKYHFVQTAEIDASETETWNDGAGFTPIALFVSELINDERREVHQDNAFYGFYNGNDFPIKNLYISSHPTDSKDTEIGLFSRTNGARLTNIRLVDIRVFSGQRNTGVLVGNAHNSIITNSSTSGLLVVDENAQFVGGLISTAVGDSQIEFCFSTIGIHGLDFTIDEDAQYSPTSNIGGLVGGLVNSAVKNSYFRGALSRQALISGGLVGNVVNSQVQYCYVATEEELPATTFLWNMGEFGSKEQRFAAFIGNVTNQKNTISHNYFDKEATGTDRGIGDTAQNIRTSIFSWNRSLIGLKTTQMKKSSSYKGWNFKMIWSIDPEINDGYPFLRI